MLVRAPLVAFIAATSLILPDAYADTVVEQREGSTKNVLVSVISVGSKRDYLKFLSEHTDVESFDLTIIPNPSLEDVFLLGSLGCKSIRAGINSCNAAGGCTELAASKQSSGSRVEVLGALNEMLDFIDFATRTSCVQWADAGNQQ